MRYFLILLGMVVGTANAEELTDTVYYCSAEASGGVAKQDGSWIGGIFEKDRYSVKLLKSPNGFQIKMDGFLFFCASSVESSLICHHPSSGRTMMFNEAKDRFIYSSGTPFSYILDDNTASVSVGTCESF